jgi:hypothetical protein
VTRPNGEELALLPFVRSERRRFISPDGPHDLRVYRLTFRTWKGERPVEAWRKPIVGPPARPFAELQLVEILEKEGWSAGWVHRPGKFLSTWQPRSLVGLPPEAISLHSRITRRAGRDGGCWDIYGWRDGHPLFLEVKRAGSSDRIRSSQWQWQEAAIAEGVAPHSFVVVEWTIEDAS